MTEPFLLSRALFRFDGETDRELDDLVRELSAATFCPDGYLWLGADEGHRLERLTRLSAVEFGEHREFPVADFIPLFDRDDEIDIEGMDNSDGYLWLTGSHSSKRKRPKGKKASKDLARLARVENEANRYLLARIPLLEGELLASREPAAGAQQPLTAARLQVIGEQNILMELLAQDEHLGPFIRANIPSKDNGLDVEGLAVHGNRVFLGLRGPVLRAWAVIIELEVEDVGDGVLMPLEHDGQRYRKHFVDLQGLGIRELCRHGDDLLILAGPTMDLDGFLRVYRLKNYLDLDGDSVTSSEGKRLQPILELPLVRGRDRAEGLGILPAMDQDEALLVVYDNPHECRRTSSVSILMDIFRLPR